METNTGSRLEIFWLPIGDKVLVYAPLHNLTALVNQLAAEQLRRGLAGNASVQGENLSALLCALQAPGQMAPQAREGELGQPKLLGLVTTRGCNMACRYCDFAAPKQTSPVMDLETARDAIDAYLNLLVQHGQTHAELHLFGGEPFYAPRTVHFAVEYAQARAIEKGLTIHFEAITNGFFNQRMAHWAAGMFDTVFLSLDGPREIQDRYRPGPGGRSTFDIVAGNARIFTENNVELILRSCVTSETVTHLSEIATWFADEFQPATVCFETMTPSEGAQTSEISPPDPWVFARNFELAAGILQARGIGTVLSTAELSHPHVSFCTVGYDPIIVTPDGLVHACYLLEEDWRREALDLTFGRLGYDKAGSAQLILDSQAIQRIRQLNVHAYPLCADCFCRFHCAGGCHVNRRRTLLANRYDATCIQTRMVSASSLLKHMGQTELYQAWLSDEALHRATVLQKGDRLL